VEKVAMTFLKGLRVIMIEPYFSEKLYSLFTYALLQTQKQKQTGKHCPQRVEKGLRVSIFIFSE
jgi:hypothetical protein